MTEVKLEPFRFPYNNIILLFVGIENGHQLRSSSCDEKLINKLLEYFPFIHMTCKFVLIWNGNKHVFSGLLKFSFENETYFLVKDEYLGWYRYVNFDYESIKFENKDTSIYSIKADELKINVMVTPPNNNYSVEFFNYYKDFKEAVTDVQDEPEKEVLHNILKNKKCIKRWIDYYINIYKLGDQTHIATNSNTTANFKNKSDKKYIFNTPEEKQKIGLPKNVWIFTPL